MIVSVLPAVKEHVGTLAHHIVLANFCDATVVELVPLLIEEVLTVGCVMPRAQTSVVVDNAVEVVHDRAFPLVC